MGGAAVPVAETTFATLRRHRLPNGERIPHLDEVLGFVRDTKVDCFFELKESCERLVRRVIDAIKHAGIDDRAWIMAFAKRAPALRLAKDLAPGIRTNVITPFPVDLLSAAKKVNADAVSFGYSRLPGSYSLFRLLHMCLDIRAAVAGARAGGITVSCGVANTDADIQRMLAYGVDAVWTDDVVRARLIVDHSR